MNSFLSGTISYTALIPLVLMVFVIGPVMHSTVFLNASVGVMPCLVYLRYKDSTIPCTPPSRIPRSPKMSLRYSLSRVVAKVNGEPMAMDHPSAMSVAFPVASWCTANEALMPDPPTSLPCSYSLRTLGPMPFGATSTTLMSSRNVSPSLCITPNRNPCDKPKVLPGFIAAKMRGYIFACAASLMSSITKSDFAMMSKVSPKVPSSSVKPHSRASSFDLLDGRKPTHTLTSIPASLSESRKFWPCAGAWLPHPITPMVLIPARASGSFSKRCRPPRTMYSPSPATSTSSFSKILVLMSRSGALDAALLTTLRRARVTDFPAT
mmetsp:Transcript_12053/g.40042  ORF Transcript_12053/g.40042 Transcript_12053/m.40042 type:complete len:322 (-) Transcript_12053:137-1102(-)